MSYARSTLNLFCLKTSGIFGLYFDFINYSYGFHSKIIYQNKKMSVDFVTYTMHVRFSRMLIWVHSDYFHPNLASKVLTHGNQQYRSIKYMLKIRPLVNCAPVSRTILLLSSHSTKKIVYQCANSDFKLIEFEY